MLGLSLDLWRAALSTRVLAQVETPAFSLPAGSYSGTQSVEITCATSGASIYYTTDGSTPDSGDTLYSGAISVSASETLKAIAVKSGMLDSDIASAVYVILEWFDDYDLASGDPDLILDFVGDQYRSSGADVALSTLITNPGTISSSGMALSTTNIVATGALLSAIQGTNCTIVAETNGGSNGAFGGIISANTDRAPLFRNLDNKLRGYQPAVLDTANTADWTAVSFSGTAFSAAGRSVALNIGDLVSDANAYAARTSVEIGSFGGGMAFGGHLRRLLVWTRRLSDTDLKSVLWPAPYLLPASGGNALKFRALEKLTVGATGSTALKFERTQAWSCAFALNKRVLPGGGGSHVVFSNVTSGAPFTGYEVFLNDSGHLQVRIISNYGTGNYLGRVGSINVCDGVQHAVIVTYDGSSTAAGVKLYVDGALDSGATTEADGLSSSIAGAADFLIGNQIGFEGSFYLDGLLDQLTMHDVARDATYVAAHATPGALPTTGANIVLSYAMDEGTGTTVGDDSGNGYDGTITSAGQWVR